MRLTSKGQVTIPIEIRERVGLGPGTEVRFSVEDDAVKITKVEETGRGKQIVRRLQATGEGTMTTDEIMALTRGE